LIPPYNQICRRKRGELARSGLSACPPTLISPPPPLHKDLSTTQAAATIIATYLLDVVLRSSVAPVLANDNDFSAFHMCSMRTRFHPQCMFPPPALVCQYVDCTDTRLDLQGKSRPPPAQQYAWSGAMPCFMLLTREQDIPGLRTNAHTRVRTVVRVLEEGRPLRSR